MAWWLTLWSASIAFANVEHSRVMLACLTGVAYAGVMTGMCLWHFHFHSLYPPQVFDLEGGAEHVAHHVGSKGAGEVRGEFAAQLLLDLADPLFGHTK